MAADGRTDVVLIGETDEDGREFPVSFPLSAYREEPLRRLALPGGGFRPPHTPLLGVMALGSWLRRAGCSVSVHDNVFTIPASRKALFAALDAGPRAVGLSTTVLTTRRSTERIARWVRERSPDALLVLGGPTAERHAAIRELGDATVVGAGEKTLEALLARLKLGRGWRDLPGLIHGPPDAEVRTGPGPAVEPDDWPAVDWGLLSPRPSRCFPIRASTGCRFNCAFCTHPERGR